MTSNAELIEALRYAANKGNDAEGIDLDPMVAHQIADALEAADARIVSLGAQVAKLKSLKFGETGDV